MKVRFRRWCWQLKCVVVFGRMNVWGGSVAKQQNIPVVGLMGILLNAKSQGPIPALKPLIKMLLEENYRLSGKVNEIVLAKAGE